MQTTVKPFMVKNYMWVFVNCLIENPAFDSQASWAPSIFFNVSLIKSTIHDCIAMSTNM